MDPKERRKIHPKVRMIANCNSNVNAVRSELSAAVCMSEEAAVPKRRVRRADEPAPVLAAEAATAPKQEAVPNNVLVSVFVHTTNGKDLDMTESVDLRDTVRRGTLQTVTLPLSDVEKIARARNVMHLELGEPLAAPAPLVSTNTVGKPSDKLRDFGDPQVHGYGPDVLIGIIDVEGFDFAHEDFMDGDKTRWLSIWDQGAEKKRTPAVGDFHADYGHVITQADMNAAIEASKTLNVRATRLEPQSQMIPGSHGTHVASTAAGNLGVCRKAMIAGVLIALGPDDKDRRRSFYDSTRIAHAVDYLVELSKQLSRDLGRNIRLSINVSLGTNGHAHDASSAISRWLDNAMTTPGRCIAVAAGNAGQEKAAFEGDLGYVLGRIHTSGRLGAGGLINDIEWIVVGDGRSDVSENELEIWYSPQDRFNVQLRTPDGQWLPVVEPGRYLQNHQLPDKTFVSIYNEVYHPANGANYISLYLSPFLNEGGLIGIAPGQWTVRLIGKEVRDGRYHGWIERDDPRPMGRDANRSLWRFPSFFSERSNVDESSVSSLACGMRVLAVANLDDARERVNMTSSQGPTRDGRFKPDVAAPGTNIIAARGFSSASNAWVAMTGTSMASPLVCGIAGLMLQIDPSLTAAQIEAIIQRTAAPLPGSSFAWINDAGFGRIVPNECLREAASVNRREELP